MKKRELLTSFAQSPNEEAAEVRAEAELAPPKKPKENKRITSFRLTEEDRQLINARMLYLMGQGVKSSDNLIFRAAIRLVPRDHRLVEKIRELRGVDGRSLRKRKN